MHPVSDSAADERTTCITVITTEKKILRSSHKKYLILILAGESTRGTKKEQEKISIV